MELENEINMESEVELKGGRGADTRMIASRTEKGNGTMELVGVKLVFTRKEKPKETKQEERIKHIRGAERTKR